VRSWASNWFGVNLGFDQINGKIQRAEQMTVHTMFVIGRRDLEANAVSVRVHGKGNLGAKQRAEAIPKNLRSIKSGRHERYPRKATN
jgi:threonyl-tRNA synthetase